jgi:hypothetical protein
VLLTAEEPSEDVFSLLARQPFTLKLVSSLVKFYYSQLNGYKTAVVQQQHSGQFLTANGGMRVSDVFPSSLVNEKSGVSALARKSIRIIATRKLLVVLALLLHPIAEVFEAAARLSPLGYDFHKQFQVHLTHH